MIKGPELHVRLPILGVLHQDKPQECLALKLNGACVWERRKPEGCTKHRLFLKDMHKISHTLSRSRKKPESDPLADLSTLEKQEKIGTPFGNTDADSTILCGAHSTTRMFMLASTILEFSL